MPSDGVTSEKKPDWFVDQPTDEHLTPVVRHLFETYSNIPADKVVDHVVQVRNESWDVYPYPCIGRFRFLDLGLMNSDVYGEVLDRVRQGQRFLDLGCCFGQEIRKLISDGAPSDNLYGCDLQNEFLELGYKLFEDRDRLKAKFLAADNFDETSALSELKETFDIIYTGSFFHLFDYPKQFAASKAVASLLVPKKGSMIVGRQVGAIKAEETPHLYKSTTNTTFHHSPESFRKMWADLGKEIGVTFDVQATISGVLEGVPQPTNPGMGWISFVVRREE
ncbi:hypothetical protein DM02DRAFT_63564 [Periconia macrospinosa]|uniref:Methyltransferase domain-containing protein n=1 Tax=Periconia macrospinosa TaxID=97972 RepID=A0A2V1DLA2_9PLEO|nr:hypothetical protein DM02DRAFT_63564 [Periconia macrospinosa]